MGTPARTFSPALTVERAYSSNRSTQCRNCCGFGHVAPRCESKDSIYPLYSLNHTLANHQCPNSTCPVSVNLKAVLHCCSSSPAHCANCREDHSALNRDCSVQPVPPTLRRSPPEAEIVPLSAKDPIDTATNGVVQRAPASPTRSVQQAYEMATPCARKSSTILTPQRPSTDQSGLPPLEPPSPSPAPRTGSGLAR